MGKFVDLTGKRFGRLVVIRRLEDHIYPSGKPRPVWECVCDCGKIIKTLSNSLTTGNTKSCTCLQKDINKGIKTKHGKARSGVHVAFYNMIRRCNSTADRDYHNYGGRGISVCERWLEPNGRGFLNFLEDMGEPSEGMTLDRTDVNGNYCKENCRWATKSMQAFNTRKRESNKSGKTGVYWREDRNRWECYIAVDGLRISLGSFKEKTDAVKAREDAEMKYFGFIKE